MKTFVIICSIPLLLTSLFAERNETGMLTSTSLQNPNDPYNEKLLEFGLFGNKEAAETARRIPEQIIKSIPSKQSMLRMLNNQLEMDHSDSHFIMKKNGHVVKVKNDQKSFSFTGDMYNPYMNY